MHNKRLRIVVTRPEKQGRELVKTLQKNGFKAISTPFFDYQENASIDKYQQILAQLPNIMIFVSVAAVEFANRALPLEQWPKATWVAVGKATSQKLTSCGIENVKSPSLQTSEGVLLLPELQQLNQKNIVIVRGESGREHMAQQLNARGAKVQYLEAYQRHWFELTQATIKQWQQQDINCITITSNDLLESVVQLINNQADNNYRDLWKTKHLWIVASERIENHALTLGIKRVVCSAGASDEAILTALRNTEQDHDR